MTLEAIYENGVLRPLKRLALARPATRARDNLEHSRDQRGHSGLEPEEWGGRKTR